MTINIGIDEFHEIVDTTRVVGFSGIQWQDSAYFSSSDDNMLLVTVGNRFVQHFIEFYVLGVHWDLGDQVIGIPFEVLSTTAREIRANRVRHENARVVIGWENPNDDLIKGSIMIDYELRGAIGLQRFELVTQQSDVVDVCAPHFYAEDSTRFRVEDARTLSRRLKTAARLFERDEMKRCKVGWSSASVINVELLKEYEWQTVINARITGPDYGTNVEQFSPVSFNPELLANVLTIGDRVVISLKKEFKGCVFTAGYHTALLMPIRNSTY